MASPVDHQIASGLTERDISLTFAKGMSVLKAFDAGHTHMTMPQITRLTGLDRAIVRRLVLTLVHLGYVVENDRVFSLTPRVLVLAGGFLQGRQFGKTVQPIMRASSQQIGLPVSLAMRDGGEAVYVAHADRDGGQVTMGFTVGSRIPLWPTAIGRALLTGLDEAALDDLLEAAPPTRFTTLTELNPAALKAEIAKAALEGYAFADGEFEAGVAAIAVPVSGGPGPAQAVLGISCPSGQLASAERRGEIHGLLHACAQALSGML